MTALRIVVLCSVALAATAGLAQAQYRDTTVPTADANATGMVTLPEYQASREAFILKADIDSDGQVSRAEWDQFAKAVRRDLDLGGVKGAELIGQGRWWTDLDANKDNMVTVPEISATTAAKFAQYDADGNGLISRSEAQKVRNAAATALR
ncbi:MAG TPA: hypothetical protein VIO94_00295 [Phenylobacterium sp.]